MGGLDFTPEKKPLFFLENKNYQKQKKKDVKVCNIPNSGNIKFPFSILSTLNQLFFENNLV